MKKIVITVLIVGMAAYLGYCGYLVKADTTAYTQLSQTISSGTLSITAPTSAAFVSKTYSFSSQTSTLTELMDNINPVDSRGVADDGWNVNATCIDWSGAASMDYDGDGSTTGQLTVDTSSATISATYGNLTGVSIQSSDSFGSGTSTITIITATASGTNGDGDYDADDFNLEQFIPGGQTSGSYNTTFTLEIT